MKVPSELISTHCGEILAAASTDLEHTTLESANGIKTTWLLLPCPLPIVQSGGARRMRRGAAAESACQFLWQLRFMAQSARRHQRRPNSEGCFFFACPLVIAKVRKKVDTNWGQLLISHTRAKLTFGSSVSRFGPTIRRVTTRRYFSELRLVQSQWALCVGRARHWWIAHKSKGRTMCCSTRSDLTTAAAHLLMWRFLRWNVCSIITQVGTKDAMSFYALF